ncbi:MAG: VOC family protein [Bacteroidetes bacterium]|nr:VOC family protein [Bacteroidota bacterium]
MKRVTGVGGIFIKSEDPKALQAWYVKHLGFPETEDGFILFVNEPKKRTHTVWSAFPENTTYFAPSNKECMFNFRVENLVELLKVLKDEGVQIEGEIQEESYGKFGWIMDPEGNKIELWEPIVAEFDKINKLES